MRVSIFTPTHRPTHLTELWESIRDQPFDEWVILANNGAVVPDFGDARIQVFQGEGTWVGDLKHQACSKCTGDILLEVDHDDLLLPGAVQAVKDAFEAHPEVGFVYSNSAYFKDVDGRMEPPDRFNLAYGWQYRPLPSHPGLEETLSFPPSPLSVSRIWFAPDHLRAWRKDVYWAAGGHDRGMRVLDDQDLIARTYLVAPFHHIETCLYLYRITGQNTWLTHNEEIQQNVMRLYDKYIVDLAAAWADAGGLKKLDLGGRFNGRPGFTSVDLKDCDLVADLRERWPFEDDSVGVIIANDLIEHLPDPIHTMKEAYRVLAHGGLFLISVPSTDGRGAFQDPTHISFWNENSFLYYTRAEVAKYIDTPVRFQAVRLYTCFPSDWHQSLNIPYAIAHLAALKDGGRPPGLIEI